MNTKDVSYLGEIWKDVRKGYQASNRGQVRSLDRWIECKDGRKRFLKGKIMKQCLTRGDYPIVNLCENGKQKHYLVHQLVWEAFNGKIPEGMEVNHIDENKQNNCLDNLNLLSHIDNVRWGTCIERSTKNRSKSVIQKTLQGEIIKIWPSLMEIHRELGYSYGNISNCCNGIGHNKTAYGYKWEYKI